MDKKIDIIRRKSADNVVLRFILAAVLAVALHLIFGIFVISPDYNVKAKQNTRHVTLLPYDTKLPSEKNLLHWMNIMDPTAIIKPNRKDGFSITPQKNVLIEEALVFKKDSFIFKSRDFLPLELKLESEKDKIARYWGFTSVSHPVRDKRVNKVNSLKNYPIVMMDNGIILPALLNNNVMVKDILSKSKKLLDETVLKLSLNNGGDFFPRVSIDSSSGDGKLDKIALKSVSIHAMEVFKNLKDKDRSVFISIKWKE